MEHQNGGNRSTKSDDNQLQQPDMQMAAQSGATNEPLTETKSSPVHKESDYLKMIGVDPSRFWPKKYRFTREKQTGSFNPLTISQRNFYEANGYLVFDDCVSKKLLDFMRDSFRRTGTVDELLVDKLLTKNDKLLQYVKCFCDERLMLMTGRLVESFQVDDMRDVIDNGQQRRQVLSRDWMYLPFRPIDSVCCAITAIEPLEHVLLVVPGTHRIGQTATISSTMGTSGDAATLGAGPDRDVQTREIFECSPERLSTLVDKSKKGFKYIDLQPGQTLIYHPGLIHGFSNDLINFRKKQLATIAYYAAADCEYIDLRDHLARQVVDEFSGQLTVPIGLNHFERDKSPLDYTSWLDKPKLIGSRGANL